MGTDILMSDWLSGYTGNNSLQELSYAPPRYPDKVKLSVGQVDFDKKFMLHSLTWKNFVRQAKKYFSIYEALL